MNKIDIYSAFEDVLRLIKQGHSKEECLQRYPQFEQDLREILDIAIDLDRMKAPKLDQEVVLRNKARVLLAASAVRANDVQRFSKNTSNPLFGRLLRLSATIAMLAGLLVTSGTGLVNAASTSLPGDNLYPVKRGWENVLLTFVFSEEARHELENKFEDERYSEINQLYAEDRFEEVSFSGAIDEIGVEHMVVGGLYLKLDDDLENLSDFVVGDLVTVIGETDDGEIQVEELHPMIVEAVLPPTSTLSPGTNTPTSSATATATSTLTATPTIVYIEPTETKSKVEDKKEDDEKEDDEKEDDEHDD